MIRARHCIGILLILLFFLASCEKNGNNFLRGKKRLNKLIEGTWEKVKLKDTDIDEEWTFENGNITVIPTEGPDSGTVIDDAFYEIKPKLFRVHMTMDGFSVIKGFNQKFEVIRLDKEALVLYSVPEKGGSVMLEFVKK